MQKSCEGLRDGQAFQGQQWREKERGKRASSSLKKGRGIYTSSQNVAIAAKLGPDNLAKTGQNI
jgi:hypothetical protein